MHPRRPALLIALAALTGCTSFHPVVPPERPAEQYPVSQTRDGFTIGVDQVTDLERVRAYFGADLVADGILPIQLVFSNESGREVTVSPTGTVLRQGERLIDPAPAARVKEVVSYGFTSPATQRRIDAHFDAFAFERRLLAPGESYRVVLFFQARTGPPSRRQKRHMERYLPQPLLDLRVEAKDAVTGEPIAFEPFGIRWPIHRRSGTWG